MKTPTRPTSGRTLCDIFADSVIYSWVLRGHNNEVTMTLGTMNGTVAQARAEAQRWFGMYPELTHVQLDSGKQHIEVQRPKRKKARLSAATVVAWIKNASEDQIKAVTEAISARGVT